MKPLEQLDEIVARACRERLSIGATGERDRQSKLLEVCGAIGTRSKVTSEAPTVSSAQCALEIVTRKLNGLLAYEVREKPHDHPPFR